MNLVDDEAIDYPTLCVAVSREDDLDCLLTSFHLQLTDTFNGGKSFVHIAVSQRNRVLLLDVLHRGLSIDKGDHLGVTPLMEAIVINDLDTVQHLLSHGANIHAATQSYDTCLHLAARYGDDDMMLLLLQRGCDMETVNKLGQTPLLVACEWSNYAAVNALLLQGADIHILDMMHRSVFSYACSAKSPRIAHLLLHVGYDNTLVIDKKGRSALSYAAESGYITVVRKFWRCSETFINYQDQDGKSALVYACSSCSSSSNSLCVVDWLLRHSANVDVQTKRGLTPVAIACQKGELQLLQHLLRYQPNLNTIVENGRNAIFFAAESKSICSTKVLEALLATNLFNIQAQDEDGWTVLMCACQVNNSDNAMVLLQYGAKVNLKAHNGVSALMVSASHRLVPIIHMLLAYNANINSQSKNGLSPAMHSYGRIAATKSPAAPYDVLMVLLETGKMDCELRDQCGRTILFYAVQHNDFSSLLLLLSYGADAHITDYSGHTLLHWAAEHSNYTMMKKLLSLHIDINAVDEDNRSALLIACALRHFEVAEVLLLYRPDVNILDKHKRSSLSYCAECNQAHLIRQMLDLGGVVNGL